MANNSGHDVNSSVSDLGAQKQSGFPIKTTGFTSLHWTFVNGFSGWQ